MELKKCVSCKVSKPVSDFGIRNDKKTGRSNSCKTCRNDWTIRSKYKLTKSQLNTLKVRQMGRCWICLLPAVAFSQGLVVDHCHKTGKIRGMLCPKCNIGLGQFNDMISRLKKAAEYLREFSSEDK